jgi:hypothetical protein
VQQWKFPGTLSKTIADGGYTVEQLYNCDETTLFYKLLPNRSLDLKKVPRKADMKTDRKSDFVAVCQCNRRSEIEIIMHQ